MQGLSILNVTTTLFVKKCYFEEVELIHVPTSDQLADIFTKALGINKFEEMRLKLGVVKIIRLD
jgi:hypothetical protein